MNKYNIKIGDYVESNLGGIGYVTSVTENAFQWVITKKNNTPNAANVGCEVYCQFADIEKYYKRIGKNVIIEKKNEFESIKKVDLTWNVQPIVSNVYAKINELIDHINAIQERLKEYDSTRTD